MLRSNCVLRNEEMFRVVRGGVFVVAWKYGVQRVCPLSKTRMWSKCRLQCPWPIETIVKRIKILLFKTEKCIKKRFSNNQGIKIENYRNESFFFFISELNLFVFKAKSLTRLTRTWDLQAYACACPVVSLVCSSITARHRRIIGLRSFAFATAKPMFSCCWFSV